MKRKMGLEVEALVAEDTRGIFKHGKVPIRKCGPEEIRIDVHWAGICHSDYHQVKAEWGGSFVFPMVPGHEIAGVVEFVGDKVTKFKVGDRVGVGCFIDSCRKCETCVNKDEQYCDTKVLTYNSNLPADYQQKHGYPTNTTYGGYCQKVVVDENYVCTLPENLDMKDAAPILCAGITLYSPLKYYGALAGGKNFKVAIVGLGGLGEMGAKLSKQMGNDIYVISTSERKREYCEKTLGVKFISSGRTDAEKNKMAEEYTGQFDLVIYTSSALDHISPYLTVVKTNGSLCLVGAPPNDVCFSAHSIFTKRKKIVSSMIGGIAETQEVLDYCAEHNIVSGVEQIKASEVNRAYEEMSNYSSGKSRFVIDVKNTLVPGDWEVDMEPVKKTAPHTVCPTATIIGAENTAGKTYYPDKDVFVEA